MAITESVNKLDTRVLLIGGGVIVAGIAIYEFLKGTNTTITPSQNASTSQPSTSNNTVNPSQSNPISTTQTGSTSTTTPNFVLTLTPAQTLSQTPSVSGSYNYVITSTYAPYTSTSTTSTYAPVTTTNTTNNTTTTTTTSTQNTQSTYNYKNMPVSNNYQYTYSTGGFGSGLNVGSNVGFLSKLLGIGG
ncbi:MAG: hypothetical protein QXH07_07400 [Thermoplasmata archaeon]